MVTVVRKSVLPTPAEVPERLREAAQAAAAISLREPRLAGFPLFFTDSMDIIEPVVAFLHEHAIQRAHTADTLRTYAEILFDWFDTLEQSSIAWDQVDGADLVVCSLQRRAFRLDSPFEPPALVRDLLDWTSRLRRRIDSALRARLFLYHGHNGIATLSPRNLIYARRRFGARVSEIVRLQAGCIRTVSPDGTQELAVIVGSIYKHETGYGGRTHEWVVPPPAIHAISVLEALSEPHRRRSGRSQLWLRSRVHRRGSFEWRPDSRAPLSVANTKRICLGLDRLVAWLKLPPYEGGPWPLSTHQGRKTFARFVALRDRTGLFALAQHLGHRDRSVTDKGYVGNDYALHEEIEQHILEESVSAWEEMLSAPALGGRGGSHIIAKRPRFRGRRMKQDLRSFAQILVQAGLTLGVCDWGYCIYRQEHSACLGSNVGPNPIYREPSTCGRCRNFVVSDKHRPYWQGQVERHQALLNEPDLPRQTLKIARERLTRATKILNSLAGPRGRDCSWPRFIQIEHRRPRLALPRPWKC